MIKKEDWIRYYGGVALLNRWWKGTVSRIKVIIPGFHKERKTGSDLSGCL